MSPIRVAVLSLMMLTAVAASGAGIYAATASSGDQAHDGYGITSFAR
ncbi:hypothetical protein [Chelativorans intermedius]|uniref:Uncharacterized protein n=1 Tax=Chelativorans intermedius TaxID=515947 RepID=A0ABV6D7R8_9HYPH|nr:hypothetical protein [Chelativorans intermedius]MCT8999844.1 hypothetical protein [Chelativorans intermedius]